MKMITPLLAVLFGIPLSVGHAFTLDAVGYTGGTLEPKPFSVFVPCYGEVVFETTSDSALVVSSAFEERDGFGGESLLFDKSDSIRILIDGGQSAALKEDHASMPAGASFTIGKIRLLDQAFPATFQSTPGARESTPAKIRNTVPEPASAALGLMAFMLLSRRRR